jgi:ATP-dependent DNA ligase
MQFLKEMRLPDFVRIVETVKCKGIRIFRFLLIFLDSNHLQGYFNSIIAKGGEGVMLREPQSLYKAGRSESLKKFKPFSDAEVKVMENNYPHGFNCQQYDFVLDFINRKELTEEFFLLG